MTAYVFNPFPFKRFDATEGDRVTALEDTNVRVKYFEETGSTFGTLTIPTGSSIVLDRFASLVDAITLVLPASGQRPREQIPTDLNRTLVETTLDINGNYVLDRQPHDRVNGTNYVTWAVVFYLLVPLISYPNLNEFNILD